MTCLSASHRETSNDLFRPMPPSSCLISSQRHDSLFACRRPRQRATQHRSLLYALAASAELPEDLATQTVLRSDERRQPRSLPDRAESPQDHGGVAPPGLVDDANVLCVGTSADRKLLKRTVGWWRSTSGRRASPAGIVKRCPPLGRVPAHRSAVRTADRAGPAA